MRWPEDFEHLPEDQRRTITLIVGYMREHFGGYKGSEADAFTDCTYLVVDLNLEQYFIFTLKQEEQNVKHTSERPSGSESDPIC